MTIEELADIIGDDLIIRRYSNQDNRYMAHFEKATIKEGIGITYLHGEGKSPAEAVNDYIQEIRGKHLVVDAFGDDRREFHVPETLSNILWEYNHGDSA